MEQAIFIFLGVLATVVTGFMWKNIIDARLIAIPGFMWVIWAFGASNVEITSRCCVAIRSYQSLTIFGLAVAAACFVYWFGVITNRIDVNGQNGGMQ